MQKTNISKVLETADKKAQYDEHVKRILANLEIASRILKVTVKELEQMSIQDIKNCISEEIQITQIALESGAVSVKTETVHEMNTEDKIPNEGTTYFDIRFPLRIPNKQDELLPLKFLINIEAQKDIYKKYDIVTRAIFYVSRMISAQLGTEFIHSNYQELKPVYSIWLCMNAPDKIGNAMTRYSLCKEDLVGQIPDHKMSYDKISIIIIYLNEKNDQPDGSIFHLLNVIFSQTINWIEKERILLTEYGIATEFVGEELESMCNLGEAIEENAIRVGLQKGMQQGMQQGESLFAELTKRLLDGHREVDLRRAIADESVREKLYQEYNLK